MTYSLLARDPETGALGGASATGNLCVGAWVLRGRVGVGVSASQGHYPSTLWGENVLEAFAKGATPEHALKSTVSVDEGRSARQLLGLDQQGRGGTFTGSENLPVVKDHVQPDLCAGGNMLTCEDVITSAVEGYLSFDGSFLRRLLAGLTSGAKNGGDARGLMSAAILIVAKDHPPIDLRVDYAPDPLRSLSDLVDRVEQREYAEWMQALPTSMVPWPSH